MLSEKKIILLKILADGEFHSGEALGEVVGVSRAAVWKILQDFSLWGVAVERVRGKGYRIAGGIDLLDGERIRQACSRKILNEFDSIDLHLITDSTNTRLLEYIRENPTAKTKQVCLAEMQEAGRGRRGRSWQSPFARNLYFSLSWPFEGGAAAMQGLSLAAGLAVVTALEALKCGPLSLKWPNDILVEGAKLGGILVEIAGDASGLCHAVIGLGLNVAMSDSNAKGIDQAWTDISRIVEVPPSRNTLVVAILTEMFRVLKDFESKGFAPYQKAWSAKSAHADSAVVLSSSSSNIYGVMRGVNDSGALLLEVDGEVQAHVGGELSLRGLQ